MNRSLRFGVHAGPSDVPHAGCAWCLAMTRILVVDDDLSVRSVVGDALRQEGYEVDAVGNGRQALAAFGKHRPDALVLDLEMPVMDGPTLVRTLRERTRWGAVPLVVVSGTAGAVNAGLQLGAQAFLSKPFELSELLRSVERVVQPD
jgi:CheY-like chemotaxis protein